MKESLGLMVFARYTYIVRARTGHWTHGDGHITVFGKQQYLPHFFTIKFMGHVMWAEELGLEMSRIGEFPDTQG